MRAVLRRHEGPALHVEQLPPQKEANVRAEVLPPTLREAALVAVVDLTIFGSAKSAIAFTATHCVAPGLDEPLAFELERVLACPGYVDDEEGEVSVLVQGQGELQLLCAHHGDALIEVFRALAPAALESPAVPPVSRDVLGLLAQRVTDTLDDDWARAELSLQAGPGYAHLTGLSFLPSGERRFLDLREVPEAVTRALLEHNAGCWPTDHRWNQAVLTLVPGGDWQVSFGWHPALHEERQRLGG